MSKKAPKPPDPKKVAAAQTQMNRETAITQQNLNMVGQSGPFGNVSYAQVGTWADGTPRYEQTTSLNPQAQAALDASLSAQSNLAGLASQQASRLQTSLADPIDVSGLPGLQGDFGSAFDPRFNQSVNLATSYAGADDFSADRQRYEDALWDRMAGDRSSADASLRATLAAKGIREGSAAWNAEMERMQRQNTDARLATLLAGGQEQQRMVDMARQAAAFGNEAQLSQGAFDLTTQQAQNAAAAQQAGFANTARQQGVNEALALRNQPLTELGAILGMGMSGVNAPSQMYGATPQTGVTGVDYAGLVNQNYQQQLANYQNQMGGLFGLGSSIIGAAGAAGGFGALFSDERLKTDVKRVGQTDSGIPIYTYRYIWGGPVHMGVMAQDVPDAAVETTSGFLAVDYGRVS